MGWEGDKGEELRSYMGHIVFVWGGVGQERTFLWNFNPIPHWPTKHHKRWLLGGMTSLIGAEGPKELMTEGDGFLYRRLAEHQC